MQVAIWVGRIEGVIGCWACEEGCMVSLDCDAGEYAESGERCGGTWGEAIASSNEGGG